MYIKSFKIENLFKIVIVLFNCNITVFTVSNNCSLGEHRRFTHADKVQIYFKLIDGYFCTFCSAH